MVGACLILAGWHTSAAVYALTGASPDNDQFTRHALFAAGELVVAGIGYCLGQLVRRHR